MCTDEEKKFKTLIDAKKCLEMHMHKLKNQLGDEKKRIGDKMSVDCQIGRRQEVQRVHWC